MSIKIEYDILFNSSIEELNNILLEVDSENKSDIQLSIAEYVNECRLLDKKCWNVGQKEIDNLSEQKDDICSILYDEPMDPQESDPPWWVSAIEDALGEIDGLVSMLYSENKKRYYNKTG